MRKFKAKVERTQVTWFEFDESEFEGEDDENIVAFELAQSLSTNDWEILDEWIDVEEVEQ